jgi:hypothetical protein
MATSRLAFAAAVMASAAMMPNGPALAQNNPLIGVWQYVDHGRPPSIGYLSFDASGNYEYRLIVGTNKAGTGSGIAITLGQYRLSGANSAVYWETRYLICPAAQNCADYPVSDPNFGRQKSVGFEMLGGGKMSMGGAVWTRVQ